MIVLSKESCLSVHLDTMMLLVGVESVVREALCAAVLWSLWDVLLSTSLCMMMMVMMKVTTAKEGNLCIQSLGQ